MRNIKIFSYGTLQKSKFARNREHKEATLTGMYEIMEGDFPLLVYTHRGNKTINGILFEVTQDEIDEIDDYESLPHLFKREEKTIVLTDGTKETAWVYLLND
ncbi:gamma-glutamylcyclotransferase family protein [Candidatus Sulfurimonas baltica]|uniref:Gamma-glutamylcyclotransferase n=1 Tax=Candidatus Sulfurimonas baltica TaxID=2740404 RepID=A0A7S7RP02_9BACT|nr:gamma-glutamylcyclotransferase family protein [Candidatus Sulfurimonas baltica]QOY53081.1 gamma-glutamylcyclotransferase [Candidatus Sulfurimonas baltica]